MPQSKFLSVESKRDGSVKKHRSVSGSAGNGLPRGPGGDPGRTESRPQDKEDSMALTFFGGFCTCPAALPHPRLDCPQVGDESVDFFRSRCIIEAG